MLLYDKYDVWNVPLDGGKATNLTQGVGTSAGDSVPRRALRRGRRPAGAEAAVDAVVLARRPTATGWISRSRVTLSAYGDRTKKSGYWQVAAGQAPTPLIWEDKNVGGVMKAANADRLVFTEQDFNEFPDYWATNTAFASPKKVTDANPFLSEFAWASKKVLIDYKDRFGQQLQGTLTLPAGYEPGKKYPMLV